MSNFKSKQQVRPESLVRHVGGIARTLGGKASRRVGLVSLFAAADLPDAAGLEDGALVYNLDAAKLQITVSGSWVDVA